MKKSISKTRDQLVDELSALKQQNPTREESLIQRDRNEEKYRLLIENSPDIIYTITPEGVFTFASPSWTMLLGHPVTEVVGKSFYAFVHPDDIGLCETFLKNVIATGQRQGGIEYRMQHADGSWCWYTSNAVPLRDEAGNVISYEGIAIGITAGKQVKDALKESQQQYLNIINCLPDAIFAIDRAGRVIAWNWAIEEMTGSKAADMLGRGNYEYSMILCGERRPILIDRVLKHIEDIEGKNIGTHMLRRGMYLESEGFVPSLNGNKVYLLGKASILYNSKGNIIGALESIRDISLRKKAEEGLRYSEERFSKAFHISPAPTVISSIDDGRYIDVNDSFLRVFGYTRKEMIGHTSAELSVWPNIDERKYVIDKLTGQGFLREEKFHFRIKTGEIRTVLLSAELIVIKGNKLILAIFNDITDQKRLEAQLRHAQKMEAIGTLAGGIAHDFNNILGAIMGYTEIALGKTSADDLLRSYLQQIFTASERARDLVQQILTFSRKSEENLTALHVSPIIKEVLNLIRASLPSTIKIFQDIKTESDTVLADPTQIHQILMNLCTNAAYAMRGIKGELKVGLFSEEVKVAVPCGLIPGMYLKLTVSDTGIGMTPATMERIFDPFFTTKGTGEGTGIGLSVVYSIVKSYGGSVTVQSEIGKGTGFSIYLPLLRETSDRLEDIQGESISGGNEHILFVDDEKILVELGESILSSLGYAVVGMTSSLEALEIFRACPEHFDLVVTDMTMPDMTGLELAKRLIRIKPGLPVIICTGFSEAVTAENVKSAGVKDLIKKPFNVRQIAESIRHALDGVN